VGAPRGAQRVPTLPLGLPLSRRGRVEPFAPSAPRSWGAHRGWARGRGGAFFGHRLVLPLSRPRAARGKCYGGCGTVAAWWERGLEMARGHPGAVPSPRKGPQPPGKGGVPGAGVAMSTRPRSRGVPRLLGFPGLGSRGARWHRARCPPGAAPAASPGSGAGCCRERDEIFHKNRMRRVSWRGCSLFPGRGAGAGAGNVPGARGSRSYGSGGVLGWGEPPWPGSIGLPLVRSVQGPGGQVTPWGPQLGTPVGGG